MKYPISRYSRIYCGKTIIEIVFRNVIFNCICNNCICNCLQLLIEYINSLFPSLIIFLQIFVPKPISGPCLFYSIIKASYLLIFPSKILLNIFQVVFSLKLTLSFLFALLCRKDYVSLLNQYSPPSAIAIPSRIFWIPNSSYVLQQIISLVFQKFLFCGILCHSLFRFLSRTFSPNIFCSTIACMLHHVTFCRLYKLLLICIASSYFCIVFLYYL